MKYYYYDMFGMHIASMIDLGFAECDASDVDLVIHMMSPLNKLITDHSEKLVITQKDKYIELDFNGKVVFKLYEGTKMEVYPYHKDHELIEIILYLLGTAISGILFQRDKMIIHGSCVAVNGQSLILTGDSGAGKSSLARGFLERHYNLVSDDLSVIDNMEVPRVYSGYPLQKLWQDTMNSFDIDKDSGKKVYLREEKYSLDVSKTFVKSDLPLKAIINIRINEDIDTPRIRLIDSNAKALECLINNGYRNELLYFLGKRMEQLLVFKGLVEKIPVYVLERPSDKMTVNQQIDLILGEV